MWIINKMIEGFNALILNAVEGLLWLAFQFLKVFLFPPTDLHIYGIYDKLLLYSQVIAGTFLVVKALTTGIKIMIDSANGSNTVTWSAFITNVAQAAILIGATPWILDKILIRISNYLVNLLAAEGVNFDHLDFSSIATAPGLGLSAVFALGALLLVFAVGVFIMAFVAAIRYVDLMFLGIIAPIMSVSKADTGEFFDTWTREAIAVTFAQPLQMLCCVFIVNFAANIPFDRIAVLLMIGAVVVAIRGPQALRQLAYKTGAATASGSIARTASYTIMRKYF